MPTRVAGAIICCIFLLLVATAVPAEGKKRDPRLSYSDAYAAALDRAHREQLAATLLYGGYQVEVCQRLRRKQFRCVVDYWGVKLGSTFPDPPYKYLHIDCQIPVLVAALRSRFYPSTFVQPGGKCVSYSNSTTASSNFP